MKIRLALPLLSLLVTNFAWGADLHSKLSHSIDVSKSGKVTITFSIHPHTGLVINADENSPWKVEMKNVVGLTETEYQVTREEFKESIPGFKLEAQLKGNAEQAFSGDIRLVAFVCTADKARCYRDVHQTKISHPD